jgi:Family of unknown function (DUF6492)
MRLAVITPSYRNDWPLFADLHESVLAYTPDSVRHYVVVPDADAAFFSQHTGARCEVIPEESLYPARYRPVPATVNRMLRMLPGISSSVRIAAVNLKRPYYPIRGWMMQQVLKMEACRRVAADVLLVLDSDVVLIREVTAETLCQNGRPRFYRHPDAIDERLPRHVQWHQISRRLLGLPPAQLPLPDYVSSFNVWDPQVLDAILTRIERVTGGSWVDAVTTQATFSEWTLYGVFMDGFDAGAEARAAQSSLCLSYWDPTPLTPEGAAEFVATVRPEDVAILIQSKSGTPLAVRRAAIRAFGTNVG